METALSRAFRREPSRVSTGWRVKENARGWPNNRDKTHENLIFRKSQSATLLATWELIRITPRWYERNVGFTLIGASSCPRRREPAQGNSVNVHGENSVREEKRETREKTYLTMRRRVNSRNIVSDATTIDTRRLIVFRACYVHGCSSSSARSFPSGFRWPDLDLEVNICVPPLLPPSPPLCIYIYIYRKRI
jgi:hypothetical protein